MVAVSSHNDNFPQLLSPVAHSGTFGMREIPGELGIGGVWAEQEKEPGVEHQVVALAVAANAGSGPRHLHQ